MISGKIARTFLWAMVATALAPAAESIGGKGPARAARSVHLKWNAVPGDAFYIEMTVERSTRGSYFMACGWSGGYFGIQELGDGRKVAIFSVWDPTKGDDPKVVRVEDRVELLHEGEGVRIKRFGGEGTGGQCMTDFDWKVGEPCRFLVRAEAHGEKKEKTAYSGWLFDPRTKVWRHLVTFRTRNGGKLLEGLYSFVEDFRRDTKSVDEVRRASFAHGLVHMLPPIPSWQLLNSARFTASRAGWEARDNINAGSIDERFYLATGGDTVRRAELNAPVPDILAKTRLPTDLPEEVWASSAGATPR